MAKRTSLFSITTFVIPLLMAFGLIFAVIAVHTLGELRTRASNTGPTLSLTPETFRGEADATQTIGVTLNTHDDTISAIQLHITYDPTIIQVTGWTAGSTLPVVLKSPSIGNGNVTVALGVQPTTPFKGTNIVGSMTVKVLKEVSSSIQIESDTQVASLGKSTNSLAGRSGTSISAPVTPTPTPGSGAAITPTLTPTPVMYVLTATPTQSASEYRRSPTPTPGTGKTSFIDRLLRMIPGRPSPTPPPMPGYIIRNDMCAYVEAAATEEHFDSLQECIGALNRGSASNARTSEQRDESEQRATTSLPWYAVLLQAISNFFNRR